MPATPTIRRWGAGEEGNRTRRSSVDLPEVLHSYQQQWGARMRAVKRGVQRGVQRAVERGVKRARGQQ